ncbi:hypothetical protein [Nitrococcus mobilis]|nr:hypothetical protein [Nitrococcus mobilis]
MFIGAPGTGKSGLAISLLRQTLVNAFFVSLSDSACYCLGL